MKRLLLFSILCFIIFSTCKKEDDLSSEKTLFKFGFLKANNPSLTDDIVDTVTGPAVRITVPHSTDISMLKAVFKHSSRATVTVGGVAQSSGSTANDFTSTVVYTVVAEDKSTASYSISVAREPSPEKEIKSFKFEKANNPSLAADAVGTIDGKNISVTVSSGAELSALKATFTLSPRAALKIGTTVQVDKTTVNSYSSPVTYTVVAEDGSTTDYTVTVTRLFSSEKSILSYAFEKAKNPALLYDIQATIDQQGRKITCSFPEGAAKDQLVATFTASSRATVKVGSVEQQSGVTPNNFSSPVAYQVVAEDGSAVNYTFEVSPEQLPTVDQVKVANKVKALLVHRLHQNNQTPFSGVEIVPITSSKYLSQKPSNALPFDCGYLGSDGKVYVSKAMLPEQKAFFKSDDQAVLYYLCQAFLKHYFNRNEMPIWLKVGFAAFESGIRPGDDEIKAAISSYGGSIPSFAELNNTTSYSGKNGQAIAYTFGEFMGVYKCWEYFNILDVNSQGITVASWWYNVETVDKLYNMWKRYLDIRILSSNSSVRPTWQQETANFRLMYSNANAFNFPHFSTTLENAYAEYKTKLKVAHSEKLTYLTMLECEFAQVEGTTCGNRYTGGTAWSSGVSSTCAKNTSDLGMFTGLLRHELAHAFQAIIVKGGGFLPAWLNEGFPSFMDEGVLTVEKKTQYRADANKSLADATAYFKHKPTYDDIAVYPNPYFNYYLLGQIMYEFIYSNGGYDAVIEVTKDPLEGFKKIGYATPEEFMNGYYAYFDANWKQ